MRPTPAPAVALLVAALSAGCGLGMMQTARTTPAGTTDAQLAAGYVHNYMTEERGRTLGNFPVQVGVRHGLDDRVDLGVALFMGIGALVDVKANLIRADRPLAVAVQAGAGAAFDPGAGAGVVHLPVRALVSYDLWSRALTPYAGAGLGLFWILGYDAGEPDGVGEPVDRSGHGDGVLLLSAGVEIAGRSDRSYFLEYSWWKPVLDDPGDGFAFAENHLFLAGTRW